MAQSYLKHYLSTQQKRIPENVLTTMLDMLRSSMISFDHQQISVKALGELSVVAVNPRSVQLSLKTKFQKKAEELLSACSFITYEIPATQKTGCSGIFASLLTKLQTVDFRIVIDLDSIPELKQQLDCLSIGIKDLVIDKDTMTIQTHSTTTPLRCFQSM